MILAALANREYFDIPLEHRNIIDIHDPEFVRYLIYLQKYLNTDSGLAFEVVGVKHKYRHLTFDDAWELEEINNDRVSEGFREIDPNSVNTVVTIRFEHPKTQRNTFVDISLGIAIWEGPEVVLTDFFWDHGDESFKFNNFNTEFELFYNDKRKEPQLNINKMFVDVNYLNG